MTSLNRAWVISPVKFEADPRHLWWYDSLIKWGYETRYISNLSDRPYVLGEGKFTTFASVINRKKYSNYEGFELKQSHKFSYSNFMLDNSIPDILRNKVSSLLNESISLPSRHSINQILRIYSGLKQFDGLHQNDLVVANDLVCAAASAMILGEKSTNVLYDAQEIFTDMWDVSSYGSLTEKERKLWLELESMVCTFVGHTVTISPGVRDLYQIRHNVEPKVVPNFVPLNVKDRKQKANLTKKFLFMGNAAPYRGIQELVQNWVELPELNISLDLFIPKSRSSISIAKLINNKKSESKNPITLLDAVAEGKMLDVMSNYDVGVIPYNYPYPYNNCSPNKFGQYVSQGLAVLSNDQSFIKSQINDFKIGEVFSWSDGNFRDSVLKISMDQNLIEFKRNSIKAHETRLNWEAAVGQIREELRPKRDGINEINLTLPKSILEKNPLPILILYQFLELLGIYENSQISNVMKSFLDYPLVRKITQLISKKVL